MASRIHYDITVMMVGLDNGGKSRIIKKLRGDTFLALRPTLGYDSAVIKHRDINFVFYDHGGQEPLRFLWPLYSQDALGRIFVVDSNDRKRIDEARGELFKFMVKDEYPDAALLIYANKQDLPNVMTLQEIIEKLGLHSITNRKWNIIAASAVTGDGLREGLEWLYSQLRSQAEKVVDNSGPD